MTDPGSKITNNGEWSSVVKGGKGKKKKKMRNARTLSLQTFFSEQQQDLDTFGNVGENYLDTTLPELDDQEITARNDLLSFFCGVLKKLGPVHLTDVLMHSEISNLSEEQKRLIDRHPNLSQFLGLSNRIAMVDDYVCLKQDVARAKRMALNQMMEQKANSPTTEVSRSQSPPNVWKSSAKVQGVDPILELPRVESLFDYNKSNTINVMFSVPPPQIITNNKETMESLKKRMQGLSKCNADLEAELEEAKREVARLKTNSSDNQLIISLQKQLETEKLMARNLKHQVAIERANLTKITEKHNCLMNQIAQQFGTTTINAMNADGIRTVTHSDDSFGLRRLVANASTLDKRHFFSSSVGSGGGVQLRSMHAFQSAGNLSTTFVAADKVKEVKPATKNDN